MSDVKIFAKAIEEKAKDQIDLLIAQEPFKDCKIRIMPDVHAGAGCVIGFTADLGDKVIPNIVGVDIGCGMLTVDLGNIEIDYKKLDEVINQNIPSGMNVHSSPKPPTRYIEDMKCYNELTNIDRLNASLGTLGGGNHFIEIDEGENGHKYLVIHTGSRNLGKQVAEIYQKKAVEHVKHGSTKEVIDFLKSHGLEKIIQSAVAELKAKAKIPKELCYLEGEERENYLHDMELCQDWAFRNRVDIAARIINEMKIGICDIKGYFDTVHNYIDNDNMVRKGAISAKVGEKVLIPLNMRDGCIIAIGRGNTDWNESAPHGAGRIMSRSKARENISLQDFTDSMKDVYSTSVCDETIDEAPQAYKPMQEIIDCIGDTVDIVEIIKPVYNFKAKEKTKQA